MFRIQVEILQLYAIRRSYLHHTYRTFFHVIRRKRELQEEIVIRLLSIWTCPSESES